MEIREGGVIQIDESLFQGKINYDIGGLYCELQWSVTINKFLVLSRRKLQT